MDVRRNLMLFKYSYKYFYQFYSKKVFSSHVILHFLKIYLKMLPSLGIYSRPSGVVAWEAGYCTKGSGFESRVRHGCQTVRSWPHQRLSGSALKN